MPCAHDVCFGIVPGLWNAVHHKRLCGDLERANWEARDAIDD